MANTSTLTREVETWAREFALPEQFPGSTFRKQRLPLTWGGSFEVDAVAEGVAVCVSTGGNSKPGQVNKNYKDALMLMGLAGEWRMRGLAFTERVLYEYFLEQSRKGRLPRAIELILLPLAGDLAAAVLTVRATASQEVSPRRQPSS